MNTLRVNQKSKIFSETGSALDATEISRIKVINYFDIINILIYDVL